MSTPIPLPLTLGALKASGSIPGNHVESSTSNTPWANAPLVGGGTAPWLPVAGALAPTGNVGIETSTLVVSGQLDILGSGLGSLADLQNSNQMLPTVAPTLAPAVGLQPTLLPAALPIDLSTVKQDFETMKQIEMDKFASEARRQMLEERKRKIQFHLANKFLNSHV